MEGHQARTRQIQAPPNTEPSLTCSIVRFLKGPLIVLFLTFGVVTPSIHGPLTLAGHGKTSRHLAGQP
jgi:hypothetical protein